MKSMWVTLSFTRERSSSTYERRIAVAERDVTDGVLVEERVEERRAQPPDTALAIDERDLAEPRGTVVESSAAAKDLTALVGGDLDGAALLEAHDEPLDDRPVEQRERPRGGDDALGASGIGRGEHLLGGEVRHVPDAVHRLATRGLPLAVRKQAHDEIRARPLEVERVEPSLAQPTGDVV